MARRYRQTDRAYDLAYAGALDTTIAETLGLTNAELEAERKRNRRLDRSINDGRSHGVSYDGLDFGGSYNPGVLSSALATKAGNPFATKSGDTMTRKAA